MEDIVGYVTGDVVRTRSSKDLVVCIQNFGFYPKNIGKPL